VSCAGGLALLCAVAQAHEPARSAGRSRAEDPASGSLAGSIVLGPKLSSRRMRFHLYPDAPLPAARPAPSFEDELQNVVVYLESEDLAKSGASRRAARAVPGRVMQQENLAFVPHVLPILKGTTVEFPNGDPIFHNVFSLSHAASFDLGRYPKGASKSVRFDEPGMIKVFCHVHSDMSAVIVVLDNPFFATPDRQGRYRIDGIPPGMYQAVGWHERARPVRRPVRIDPGATTRRDFSIPLADEASGAAGGGTGGAGGGAEGG
jgi:plastocyanin